MTPGITYSHSCVVEEHRLNLYHCIGTHLIASKIKSYCGLSWCCVEKKSMTVPRMLVSGLDLAADNEVIFCCCTLLAEQKWRVALGNCHFFTFIFIIPPGFFVQVRWSIKATQLQLFRICTPGRTLHCTAGDKSQYVSHIWEGNDAGRVRNMFSQDSVPCHSELQRAVSDKPGTMCLFSPLFSQVTARTLYKLLLCVCLDRSEHGGYR